MIAMFFKSREKGARSEVKEQEVRVLEGSSVD